MRYYRTSNGTQTIMANRARAIGHVQQAICDRRLAILLFVLLLAVLGFVPGRRANAAELTSSSGQEFFYVRIFSAKIPNGLHKPLDELEAIARECGTEEIVMFRQSDGPEKQAERWIIRLGSEKHAYPPGLTVKVRTHLARQKRMGALQVSSDGKRATAALPKQNARLQWVLPKSVRSPLLCDIYEDNKLVAVNTIHERLSPSGKHRWPKVIHIKLPHKDWSIIQVFEYLDKRPEGLGSQQSEPAEYLSGGEIVATEAGSQETVPTPSNSDDIKSSTVSLVESGVTDTGHVSFSAHLSPMDGGLSYDYNTGWQPVGSPVQIYLGMVAGADISSSVWGDFELDYTAGGGYLKVGDGRGNLEMNIGVEMTAQGQVDVDLVFWDGKFTFDIPYLPNFDLRCADTTSFRDYLLKYSRYRPARLRDNIDAQRLYAVSVGGLPKVADVSVAVDAEMSLTAEMSAKSITTTTSDGNDVKFTYKGQSESVTFDSNGYSADAVYDVEFDVTVTVTFYPSICAGIDVWIYSWEYCVPVLKVPWKVVEGSMVLPFSSCLLNFDPSYALTIRSSGGGRTLPPPGIYHLAKDSNVSVIAIQDRSCMFDGCKLDGNVMDTESPYGIWFGDVFMDSNHALDFFFLCPASAPSPPDGAEDVDADVVLSWTTRVDPNSYHVYLGTNPYTSNNPNEVVDVNHYDPNLDWATKYFWRVDTIGHLGSVLRGEYWSFTTGGKASNPDPPDGAEYVMLEPTLSWSPGAGAANVNGHDVYFSTDYNYVNEANSSWPVASGPNDPNVYKGRQDANSYDTCGLEPNTTYFWRIGQCPADYNQYNVVPGDIWSFTTMPDIPITDLNLIGWWTFDEGQGPMAIDWSGHSNHGSIMGDAQWVAGVDGSALDFDGLNDYVDCGNVDTPGAVTIATWVKRTGSGEQAIISKVTNYNIKDYDISTRNGRLTVWYESTGADVWVDSDQTLPTDQWTHIAIAFDTLHSGEMYINGVFEKNWDTTEKRDTSTQPVNIGRRAGTYNSNYFYGIIDDVRIYDKTLMPAQIKKLAYRPRASNPDPADGATSVSTTPTLSWWPGKYAASHDVYFGIDKTAVIYANEWRYDANVIIYENVNVNSYNPGGLDLGQSYYWRVDAVNEVDPNADPSLYSSTAGLWIGNIWSFTVNFVVVDDFEDYTPLHIPDNNIPDNNIFDTWKDGRYNDTGSLVSLESTILHGDTQAMKFEYNNTFEPYTSEAQADIADLGIDSNWEAAGIKALVLYFYGDPCNAIEPMWVKLADTAGNNHAIEYGINTFEYPNDINVPDWHEWNIALQDFKDPGVDLTDVNKITIGFGEDSKAGGTGTVHFDDIRLYKPRCIPKYWPLADLTDDCRVNFLDFAIMAADWLPLEAAPSPAGAWWKLDGNAEDSADANPGTEYGSPTYGPGKFNQAIDFDGTDDYITVDDSAAVEFGNESFSIALWVKSNFVAYSLKQFIICNGTNGTEFDGATGKRYAIKFEESNFRFLIDDDITKTVVNGSNANFANADWVHAVAVRDAYANEIHLYCNGKLENSTTDVVTGDIASLNEPLFIGAKQQENANAPDPASAPIDHYFVGMLDEVRIYDYAMSPAEVLYISGLAVDLNDDNKVDFEDFTILAIDWLEGPVLWP